MTKYKPHEHCQFCGKNPDEVEAIIENGDSGIRICSICVELSMEIIANFRHKKLYPDNDEEENLTG